MTQVSSPPLEDDAREPIARGPRSRTWRWYVCGLLLLATTINYMDRQTLSTAAVRIKADFGLSNEQYGELETGFGLAFAVGATFFGFVADRTSVRWLYPAVLLCWSVMGFSTGLVQTYIGLFWCRTLLGFFEAGHWPCALKTTQRLLPPRDRTMANSILQSGTSIGAIVTPLVMSATLTDQPGSWRFAFQLIGVVGLAWIALWFVSIRQNDLTALPPEQDGAMTKTEPIALEQTFLEVILTRRFVVLLVMVTCINICWHVIRVWLPLFLMEGRGYSEAHALYFVSAYYVATDVGCIAAGAATLWLGRRGFSVHGARGLVFLACALLTALSVVAALLPQGWLQLGMLLAVGAGALGLFPCYYSYSQELTVRHQGKLSGVLGSTAWVITAVLHKYLGQWADLHQSYDAGIALAGLAPLVAVAALAMFWNRAGDR